MEDRKIKFFIDYDKSYSHTFASGVEISAISPDRLDLTFHYEHAHLLKEVESTLKDGLLNTSPSSASTSEDIIEIDRIIKTAVSIDIQTAKSMLSILQNQLEQLNKL